MANTSTGAAPACLTWQSAANFWGRERERRMGSAATATLVGQNDMTPRILRTKNAVCYAKNSICSFF